jgi:hypothetical protein
VVILVYFFVEYALITATKQLLHWCRCGGRLTWRSTHSLVHTCWRRFITRSKHDVLKKSILERERNSIHLARSGLNLALVGALYTTSPAVPPWYHTNHRVIKTSLCTWWLLYRKLQVMFKVSPASLQTFIDTRLTLTPSVDPNSKFVITVSDWNCLKYFCLFFVLQSSGAQRLFDRPVLNLQRSIR